MPCPAPSLLPRQPRLTPDPSGDIPSRRATRSSCDSQPPLRSARTPCVPPGPPVRLRHPDVTPTSGPWLPVSEGGPGDVLLWGCAPGNEGAPHPPLLLLFPLAEAASHLWLPQVPPGPHQSSRCHCVPGTVPGVSSEGVAQHGTVA